MDPDVNGTDLDRVDLSRHRTRLFGDGIMQSEQPHMRKDAPAVKVQTWVKVGKCVQSVPNKLVGVTERG